MARKKRSPRRGREFWKGTVEAWRRSGESVRTFCAGRGLTEPSFYVWRKRLSDDGRKASPFVPVKLVAAAAVGSVEVELGSGKVVRFPLGMDPETASRWVSALEG